MCRWAARVRQGGNRGARRDQEGTKNMTAPEGVGGGLGRGWRGVGGALRKKLKTRALQEEDAG